MRYFFIVMIFLIPMGNLRSHEDSIYTSTPIKYVHFHNVKWKSCFTIETCLFHVSKSDSNFKGQLSIMITQTYGPNNIDPGCMAEYRYAQIILSELENRFINSKIIDLVKCQKTTDFADLQCDVLVDEKSIDKWLKRKFFLRDFYIPWCKQLEPE